MVCQWGYLVLLKQCSQIFVPKTINIKNRIFLSWAHYSWKIVVMQFKNILLTTYICIIGTVVGWGFDETGQVTEQLHKAQMPIVSQDKCRSSFPEFYTRFTSDRTFCAGFQNGKLIKHTFLLFSVFCMFRIFNWKFNSLPFIKYQKISEIYLRE